MECFSFTHTSPGHNQVSSFLVHSVWLSGKLLTLQKAKTQFEETEQASKPDTAEMLDLSNQKYKRTIIC